MLRMLNRFGHGVLYSQLEENDTALCLQILAANLNQTTILPGAIQPNAFTNLPWDNIDRLEETLTGGGTTHRVNGTAVQPRVFGPHLPAPQVPPILKQKQRSIIHEEQPCTSLVKELVQVVLAGSNLTNIQEAEARNAQAWNLTWAVARQTHVEDQRVPGWSGFHVQTRSKEDVWEDVVAYLPTIINAPATELSTINEILRQSEDIRKRLYLDQIIVLDQALYAKACEVAWKNRELYEKIILRLRTFYTICNLLSIIRKRFQDVGLSDVCIECGILAGGSVCGVMEGKVYNRAVRIHKYIYEALMRLVWKQFVLWLTVNQADKVCKLRVLQVKVSDMVNEVELRQCESILNSDPFKEIHLIWMQYLQYLCSENGPLSCFWMSYTDIVGDVLLGLIRASHEGNWQLHLYAIRNMIPWCYTYDKINYARYLPVYYAQMINLLSEHPNVYSNFMNGRFFINLLEKALFGAFL